MKQIVHNRPSPPRCRWPKTLIVVSHAREFLNTVCTDILHLHSRSITTYRVGCVHCSAASHQFG